MTTWFNSMPELKLQIRSEEMVENLGRRGSIACRSLNFGFEMRRFVPPDSSILWSAAPFLRKSSPVSIVHITTTADCVCAHLIKADTTVQGKGDCGEVIYALSACAFCSWPPTKSIEPPAVRVSVGKIPDTRFLNPNYPNPDPKYPIAILDSDCKKPKLVWVIRVMFPGTRTTQITRNISNICSSVPNTKT
jgi:hypothetical protein